MTQGLGEKPPRAVLLEDGHVEFTHDCLGETLAGVLPSPPWRVVTRAPLQVEPSVQCFRCGLHGWIGDPRNGWVT